MPFPFSYSLLVLDNPNLQDLWLNNQTRPDGSRGLKILNGRTFFHLNPKLCYNKIVQMLDYVDVANYSRSPDGKSWLGPNGYNSSVPWVQTEVSSASNGDKAACDVLKLNIIKIKPNSTFVVIEFEDFRLRMNDDRSLLGYLIYYRQS